MGELARRIVIAIIILQVTTMEGRAHTYQGCHRSWNYRESGKPEIRESGSPFLREEDIRLEKNGMEWEERVREVRDRQV